MEDLADRGVVEIRPESPAETLGFVAEMRALAIGEPMERGIELVDTETKGAREFVVKGEEFGDLPSRHVAVVGLEIRFHAAARAQNGHPLGDVDMAADLFPAG